jgi:ribosomal protein RSM22 (predicted rRNA methylase)
MDISLGIQGEAEGWWEDCAEDGVWCTAGMPPYSIQDWARIIEPPVKGKRQVTMRLLTPIGTVETLVVSKRVWAAVPGAYAMARRAEWGGLWPWPTPMTPD